MFIEPGIMEQASKAGIKGLTDLNHDGKIDGNDLNMARAGSHIAPLSGASEAVKLPHNTVKCGSC